MKRIYSLIAMAMLIFTLACKKDKNNGKMDIISSGDWKIITINIEPGYDYNADGNIDTEIFQFYDACERDNSYRFRRDGTLEINEGPLKCNPSDDQVEYADWEFIDNETGMVIEGQEGRLKNLPIVGSA